MNTTFALRFSILLAAAVAVGSCNNVPAHYEPIGAPSEQASPALPAKTSAGTPAPSAMIAAQSTQYLTHRYSFKTDARDSIGKMDGKLFGDATIDGGKLVMKNDDAAKPSYLEFSESVLPKGTSVSLVMWFSAREVGAFARLMNFGDQDAETSTGRAFIYVTPKNSDGNARFAISATDAASKTNIDTDALDDGNPHMIAMVIDGDGKKLHVYVDDKEPKAAENLGDNTLDKIRPVQNWIGRSSFVNDPYFAGAIDEFRVYDHALNVDDVLAIYKAGADALPMGK